MWQTRLVFHRPQNGDMHGSAGLPMAFLFPLSVFVLLCIRAHCGDALLEPVFGAKWRGGGEISSGFKISLSRDCRAGKIILQGNATVF